MSRFDRFQPPTRGEEMAAEKAQIEEDLRPIIMDDEDLFRAEIGTLRAKLRAAQQYIREREAYHDQNIKGMKAAYQNTIDSIEASRSELIRINEQLRNQLEEAYAAKSN